MSLENKLNIAIAQISPVWLNKLATLSKVKDSIYEAAGKGCKLIVFSEGFVPGYPFWLAHTNGSSFNDQTQKEIFAHYASEAVQIQKGDLDKVCQLAKSKGIAIYLGIIERAEDRGGHSLYCSLVYINSSGEIKSVHRKLCPTFEERLVWSSGDGNGLQVHDLNKFTVGGLNCWENWMPLTRTALYGQGENLHIAVWPGSVSNTHDITKLIAKESRSFVISASAYMSKSQIPLDIPHRDLIIENMPKVLADGGSCVAMPNGEWLVSPVADKEEIILAELNYIKVLEERQNFDPTGHYSRPDVTKLIVDRTRQSAVVFEKLD